MTGNFAPHVHLDRLWPEFDVVEVDETVMRRAAERASAEQVEDDDPIVASGDRQLITACRTLGMATADVNPAH